MITSSERRIRPRQRRPLSRPSHSRGESALFSKFQDVLSAQMGRLSPADDAESKLIRRMVAASWRLRRASLETRFIDSAIGDRSSGDDLGRIATAFSQLAARPGLPLLLRYQTRLHRDYHRTLHKSSCAASASRILPRLLTRS